MGAFYHHRRIMNNLVKKYKTEIAVMIGLGILFAVVAYFSNQYQAELQAIIDRNDPIGVLSYILITVIAVVVAPISTFPLLPVAVTIWGSWLAAIYTIIGWTVGAMIAFYLARRFGRPLISKFVDQEKIEAYGRLLPRRHLFWSLVLLRMIAPVDLLSYAAGLFLPISFWSYTLASLLGVAPFAFVFSYVADQSIIYQLAAGVLAVLVVGWGGLRIYRRQNNGLDAGRSE